MASAATVPGDPAPSISSDKADYAPGSPVTLSGAGWAAGESVHITVNDDQGATWSRDTDVTADANGAFQDQFNLPDWFVATYSVKATGASGTVATTSFTDGNVAFALATAGTSAPSNLSWAVNWKHYGDSNCPSGSQDGTGTANYSGNTLSSGTQPAVGNKQSAIPDTVAASGYALDYWTSDPASTTPLTTAQLCANGSGNTTLYAHFKSSIQSTSMNVAAATGTYGGTVGLSATLTSGTSGVSGKTVSFTLKGATVGSATTNASGVATLSNVSLAGIDAGSSVAGVGASFAGDSGFAATSGSGSLTVNAKSLTGSFTTSNKTYDGTTAATIATRSLSGVVGTDDVGLTGGTATFADRNAGTGKTVTGTGFSLTGAKAANYTLSSVGTTTADITRKGLTIGGATAGNKTYDRTTAATVSFTGATLNGVVGTDAVSINATNVQASFGSATAGTGKAVTVTGVALAGADAGNYTVAQPTGLTADITRKGLTVAGAKANTKTYDGNATATVDFSGASLTGVVSGDTVSPNTSGYAASFDSRNAGTGKAVTVTGVALAGSDAGNYTVAQPTGLTADITRKGLTLDGAKADNKTYDGNNAATVDFSSASLTGVVSGDSVSRDTTGYAATFDTRDVGTAKPVTVTGVALSGADAGNYTVAQPSGLKANVTAKGLTLNGSIANRKVYDGTIAATVDFSGASLSGVVSGDSVSRDTSGSAATFDTAQVGTGKPVTVTGVALSGTDAGNYTVAQPSGLKADITRKGLTLDGAKANSKTYDGTTGATVDFSGASLTGVVSGDTVARDTSGSAATFDTAQAGTGKPVTVTGVALSGTDAGNYTVAQPSGLNADITAKAITLDGAQANDKVYDGTTTASVDFSGASLHGVVSGDAVGSDHTGYQADFDTAKAGTGKSVTVTGVVLTGADRGNYSLSQPAGLKADITRRGLTLNGATANSKVYDGNNNATVDFSGASLTGVIAGDSVTRDTSGYAATFDSRNVGTGKPVTATGVTLSGTDAGNYTVAQPSGLKADITAKGVTLEGAKANSKTYDGNTTATVDFANAALHGVVSGDTVGYDHSGYQADFDTKDAGTGKAVSVTGVVLTGAEEGNYSLSQPFGLTADVQRRAITVTADAQHKTYGQPDPALTYSITSGSLVSGEHFSGSLTRDAGNAVAGSPYAIRQGTLTAGGDYDLSYVGANLTVSPKGLTITGATANSKTYNGLTTATVDFSGASLNGVEIGDTVLIDHSGYTAGFDTAHAGTAKPVTVEAVGLTGADAGNYTVAQPTGLTAGINKRPVTVTADPQSKTYGQPDPDLTYKVTNGNLVAGDAFSGSLTRDAGNTVAGSPYAIRQGTLTAGSDYDLSYVGANLTVDPKGLTITGATANSKTYDGSTTATVDFSGASLNGVETGDTVTIDHSGYAASFATVHAGTAKAVAVIGVGLTGSSSGNYTVDQPGGLTADVNQRPITVTANPQFKTYGDTDPALTSSVTSGDLVSGDGFSGHLVRDSGETVADSPYAIRQGTLTAGGDYDLSYVGADLSISRKNLTLKDAVANGKVYDGNAGATVDFSGASLVGVVGTDAVSRNTANYHAAFDTRDVGTGKPVTVTGVDLSGADAGNYTLSQPAGLKAGITAKGLTISGAVADSRIYDGSDHATVNFSGATLNGVVTGDTVTIDSSGYSAKFDNRNVGTAKPVTVSGVSLGGGNAGNYTVSQPGGLTADIAAKLLTIKGASADHKVYDGNDHATVDFTNASLVGVVGGDGVGIDSSGYQASFDTANAGTGKAVAVSGVALNGADKGNYSLAQPSGLTADIGQRAITVTADAQTKTYGDADPALTYKVTTGNLVAGDGLTGSLVRDSGTTVAGSPYQIRQGSLSAGGNYALTYVPANLTVTPKALTGNFTPADKVYNGDTNATITGSSLGAGRLTGDDVTLDGSAATATFGSRNVGTRTVTSAGFKLAGADRGNYSLAMNTTTANITPKAITGSFTAADKVYDGTTSTTITGRALNNTVFGDDVSLTGGTATFDTKNAGTGKTVTGTGFGLGGTDKGNYSLSSVATTTARITPKGITGNFTAADKIYDGTTAATITSRSLNNTVSGDTVSLSGGTATFDTPDVGQNKTVAGTGFGLAGTDKDNYSLTSVATTTASITYAPATATCLGSPGHTILQPINTDGSSVFKQGSTVPAKFRVCDAAGNSIGTAGVVKSFQQVQTINGTTSTVNEVVDSTTPDTTFRWSATDQQWIFNMNTKSLSAGKTYQYRITLADGTFIDFKFGLK